MIATANLQITLLLALVSVAGIVGMLLLDGIADLGALLLAVTPLVFAIRSLWKNRSSPGR